MSDVNSSAAYAAQKAPQAGDVSGAVVPESDGVGFTLGPWLAQRQDDDSGEIYWAIHARKNYEFITNVSEHTANARLIAAAPDLYDAVRVALGWATGGMDGDWRECDHIEVMRAALAKATGTSQESTAPASSPVPEVTGA